MKRPDVSKRQKENNIAKRKDVRKKISKNRKGKGLGKRNANNNPLVRMKKRNSLIKFYKENPEAKVQKSQFMKERYINNPELLIKRRVDRINQILKNGCIISIGKNETKILNNLEFLFRYKIIRQYEIDGYFVDGYIPELNLVIEIDENHHFTIDNKLKKKDIERQKYIQNQLHCKFLRIKDK